MQTSSIVSLADGRKLGEARSFENPAVPISDANVVKILGLGGSVRSGVSVTPETSIGFTAIWAAVQLLSRAISSLPASVFEQVGENTVPRPEHPVHRLVAIEPNELMPPCLFWEALVVNLLLYGRAGAANFGDGSLVPVWSPRYTIHRDSDGRVRFLIYDASGGRLVPAERFLHVPGMTKDGISGLSPIETTKEAIGLGIAAERFGSAFFGNGMQFSGVVKHPTELGDRARRNIEDSWREYHEGVDQSFRLFVLEEGMEFQQTSVEPDKAQFLETRRFQIGEVARIFGVPVHMLGDLERATFSNIEHQSIEFVRHSLRPLALRFEQELNRKLFEPSERGRFFVRFDFNALLRGDSETRAKFYESLFRMAAITPNQIRASEGLNPYDGGDSYYLPPGVAAAGDRPAVVDEDEDEDVGDLRAYGIATEWIRRACAAIVEFERRRLGQIIQKSKDLASLRDHAERRLYKPLAATDDLLAATAALARALEIDAETAQREARQAIDDYALGAVLALTNAGDIGEALVALLERDRPEWPLSLAERIIGRIEGT